MQTLDELAKGYLASVASLLGLSADAFQTIIEHHTTDDKAHASASSFQAMHYLPLESTAASTSCQADVEEGLLTLIYSDAPQSIQVRQVACYCTILLLCGLQNFSICLSALTISSPHGLQSEQKKLMLDTSLSVSISKHVTRSCFVIYTAETV